MTHERFLEILEAYGANPDHWPEAEREAARAYATAHPELVESALALEAELDALLGQGEVEPSECLEARILESLPQRQPAILRWRAPIAAAAVLIAISIGIGTGLIGAPAIEDDTLYYDDFAGLDEDWVDWLGEDV